MPTPNPSPDRVAATLSRSANSRALRAAEPVTAARTAATHPMRWTDHLRPRLIASRLRARFAARSTGLIIAYVGRDRHMPAYRINWWHPMALPFCCMLCVVIPCVIVWQAPVIVERLRLRRSRRRAAAEWRRREWDAGEPRTK